MNGIITNFDYHKSFWDIAGPTIELVPAFSDFKAADKTKGKKHSSDVMWAVCLYSDTNQNNRVRNKPADDKRMLIEEMLFAEKKNRFQWERYQLLIEAYLETQLTANQRALKVLKDKMIERSAFLEKTAYNVENAKDLDSIVANSEKLFKIISSLEKIVDQESSSHGELKGGRRKGLQEKGGF